MNPVIEAIKGRRSVRSYTPQPVPRELVEAVIDAANWAPSACNMQQWRFVVVQDEAFRQRLLEASQPGYRKAMASWLRNGDPWFRQSISGIGARCHGWSEASYEQTVGRMAELPDGVYFVAPVIIFVIGTAAADCYLACQNLMLAAYSLGLGSCYVGFGASVSEDEGIVAALEIKQGERIYGPIVVGYPTGDTEPPEKRPPVVKRI